MACVLVVGVELAALRAVPFPRSSLWDLVAVNLPVAVLLTAALLARYGPPDAMAWWFGFALFGGAQFLVGAALLPHHDDFLMPVTHRATLAVAGWYWDTDAEHRFQSLNDIVLNPGYGGLLEALYLKANGAVSLVVAVAGGLLTHLVVAWRTRSRP
jgi:hypothetical protein